MTSEEPFLILPCYIKTTLDSNWRVDVDSEDVHLLFSLSEEKNAFNTVPLEK